MYAFKNGSIVPVNSVNVIETGEVTDARVIKAEKAVIDLYKVTAVELTDWRNNSEAKIMLCFMLHEHLHYSIGSLAKRYKIYHLYLRNQINETYVKCLQQPAFYNKYTFLKDVAFADVINSSKPAASNVEAVGFFN